MHAPMSCLGLPPRCVFRFIFFRGARRDGRDVSFVCYSLVAQIMMIFNEALGVRVLGFARDCSSLLSPVHLL
jgi:hypothetical protein